MSFVNSTLKAKSYIGEDDIAAIDSMEDSDAIWAVFVKILLYAYTDNHNGYVALWGEPVNKSVIPQLIHRPVDLVEKTIQLFCKIGVFSTLRDYLFIKGLEDYDEKGHPTKNKRTKYMREYMREYRRRKKMSAKYPKNDTDKDGQTFSALGEQPSEKEYAPSKFESLEGTTYSANGKSYNTLQRYGKYGNVYLTDQQYNSLVGRFGKASTTYYIHKLDRYIYEKNAVVKGHYSTLSNWITEDSASN